MHPSHWRSQWDHSSSVSTRQKSITSSLIDPKSNVSVFSQSASVPLNDIQQSVLLHALEDDWTHLNSVVPFLSAEHQESVIFLQQNNILIDKYCSDATANEIRNAWLVYSSMHSILPFYEWHVGNTFLLEKQTLRTVPSFHILLGYASTVCAKLIN